jgi:hypothetical protein
MSIRPLAILIEISCTVVVVDPVKFFFRPEELV